MPLSDRRLKHELHVGLGISCWNIGVGRIGVASLRELAWTVQGDRGWLEGIKYCSYCGLYPCAIAAGHVLPGTSAANVTPLVCCVCYSFMKWTAGRRCILCTWSFALAGHAWGKGALCGGQ